MSINDNLKNKTTNIKSMLGVVRKYIFSILLVIGLIIGNSICYTENNRFLKPTTNLVIGFLIISSFINSKK